MSGVLTINAERQKEDEMRNGTVKKKTGNALAGIKQGQHELLENIIQHAVANKGRNINWLQIEYMAKAALNGGPEEMKRLRRDLGEIVDEAATKFLVVLNDPSSSAAYRAITAPQKSTSVDAASEPALPTFTGKSVAKAGRSADKNTCRAGELTVDTASAQPRLRYGSRRRRSPHELQEAPVTAVMSDAGQPPDREMFINMNLVTPFADVQPTPSVAVDRATFATRDKGPMEKAEPRCRSKVGKPVIGSDPVKVAVICTGEQYKTMAEMAKGCRHSYSAENLLYNLRKLGIIDNSLSTVNSNPKIAKRYRDHGLAVQGLVQDSHGAWIPDVLFTRYGEKTIRELVDWIDFSDEADYAALFMDTLQDSKMKQAAAKAAVKPSEAIVTNHVEPEFNGKLITKED